MTLLLHWNHGDTATLHLLVIIKTVNAVAKTPTRRRMTGCGGQRGGQWGLCFRAGLSQVGGPVPMAHQNQPPLPFPSLGAPPPFPFPSPPFRFSPHHEAAPLIPARRSGERCKVPQRGPGRSPSCSRILLHCMLAKCIWLQHFWFLKQTHVHSRSLISVFAP